ncbi:MAG: FAD-dependent monooxygenase, partial [Candidatus Eremiobacteraeota bacterium]|nr:FAD-dependent monooxygenase [Candidatus Eremiobacteraeota bacterium]
MHDAIVVGAGPAGSTAAYLLAAQGYDVMVIERARFPRVKVCGEYLNAGAVATLRRLGVSAELRPFALDGIVMHAHDLRVRLPVSGEAWAVPRSDLDAALATQARTAGAKCVTGTAVDLHLESDSASVRFIDSSGGTVTLAARFVIGADGIGSLVARKAGLALSVPARARFAIGGHYRGFSGDGRCVEMFVDGPAYFAVNPLGGDIANVMMVVRSQTLRSMSHALDEEFAVRAEAMMRGNRHFHSIERVGKRVSIGPLAHRTRGLAKGRVLLAGDAASFIDP